MNPIAYEWLDPGRSLALGNLVFMMRAHQLLTTTVDIQHISQLGHGHAGACYVPARSTWSPRALPKRLSWAGSLPQSKVHGVLFIVVYINPSTSLHAIQSTVA